MNTPAHLILGAAVFARPARFGLLGAALLGGLAPDLSLYVLGGVSLFILQIPPQVVFNELYFSDAWQTVFAIDNSVFVWGAILAFGAWRGWPFLQVMAAAALLHIALDFPLHHDDGRPHFWPFTGWVFESPLSYWDMRRGAGIVAPVEGVLAGVATWAIWQRFPQVWPRVLMAVLLLAELWVIRGWYLFSG